MKHVVAVVLLLLAVPAAAAGPVTFESVQGPAQPILPEMQSVPLVATVAIDCQAALEWTGMGLVADAVQLDLRIDAAPEILVVGPKTILVPVDECVQNDVVHGVFELSVAVTRSLPGLVVHDVGLTVDAGTAGPLGPAEGEARAEETVPVVADYYSLVQAKIHEKVQEVGRNGQAEFVIEVQSFGNARTLVTFGLSGTEADPGPEPWDVLLPPPLILDRGDQAEALLVVRPPVDLRGPAQASLQVEMVPKALADPSREGGHVTANVLARMDREAPGLDTEAAEEIETAEASSPALAALVAVGLVALAALRRRR